MELTQIDRKSKYYKAYQELYNEAFPKEERISFEFMTRQAKRNRAEMLGLTDNCKFVGLAWNITNGDLSYLFFLAVRKEYRGKGYGTIFLKLLRKRYADNRIILCIEEMNPKASNYEQRCKRKKFYEKNGFYDANMIVEESGGKFEFLINSKNNRDVFPDEYVALIRKMSGPLWFPYTRRVLLRNIEKV